MVYDFQFRREKDTKLERDLPFHIDTRGNYWFLVGRILDFENREELDEFLDECDFKDSGKFAKRTLRRLWDVIHKDLLINYYLEESQEIDKVVDIFIRTNAGGTHLSFSDLLLSMATAGWQKIDARNEIYKLVDEINSQGFSFDKDFVLKTLLVVFSSNIRFKIENFNSDNIRLFEDNWNEIRKSIATTIALIKKLGFTGRTLTSNNSIIPIVDYMFKKGFYTDFDTSVRYEKDRKIIVKYLHIALLTRLFGGQSDRVLQSIRRAIADNLDQPYFPLAEIRDACKRIDRDISFSPEFVKGLLTTQKDDVYAFSILALLYPTLDYNNVNYHKDHLHPAAAFTEDNLDKFNIVDPDKRTFYLNSKNYNSILNLQLLSANKNEQKQDMPLEEWVNKNGVDLDLHAIPTNVSLAFEDFEAFIDVREKLLTERFGRIFQ